jgi:DNA-binding transcriptional LysR family regulator
VTADPLGLGVLPRYALDEELRTGRIGALALQPDLPPLRLEAMLDSGRTPRHPAIMALLDTLRSTMTTPPGLRTGRGTARLSRN